MTTYTWPDARAFVPQAAELRIIDNLQRVHESPLSGYTQTQDMPGARWGWSYDLTPHSQAERRAVEAFLTKLSGRAHRVRLWDFKHARPAGNINLAGVTLGAAAAQFATSLQLAGCFPGTNYLRYPTDLRNTSEAGSGRPWSQFDDGGVLNHVLVSLEATTGPAGEAITVSKVKCNTTDTVQRQVSQQIPGLADGTVCVSYASMRAAEVKRARLYLQSKASTYPSASFNLETGAVTSVTSVAGYTTVAGVIDEGGGWYGCWARTNVLTGGATPAFIIQLNSIGGTAYSGAVGDGLFVRRVGVSAGDQLVDFAEFGTLLAGDWIGLPSGQLLRVVEDAQADNAGVMTVAVRHMLRSAVASGGAVTLDKPTALFMRTESGLALPRQPGATIPGFSVDFVEAFA